MTTEGSEQHPGSSGYGSSWTSMTTEGSEHHPGSSGYGSSLTSLTAESEHQPGPTWDSFSPARAANDAEIPRNFSWVIADLLCACAFPASSTQLRYLANRGVTTIVSLTAERALPEQDVKGDGFFCLSWFIYHNCFHCSSGVNSV